MTRFCFFFISLLTVVFYCSGAVAISPAVGLNPANVYWVILAGGSGTRLWPLSRELTPKQFLSIGGGKSLVAESIDRLKTLPDFEKNHLYISSHEKFSQKFVELKNAGYRIDRVINEPGRRDTAPATLLTLLTIYRENPDAYVSFLPADHYFPEHQNSTFSAYLVRSLELAFETQKIVLLGKKAEFPSSEFGYIESLTGENPDFSEIIGFHEKPSTDTARALLQRPGMSWNMGIFSGKVEVFIELFKRHSSKLYHDVVAYLDGKASYEDAQKISVDYAIMEPSAKQHRLAVLSVGSDLTWSDVGSIQTFIDLKSENYNKHEGFQQEAQFLPIKSVSESAKNNRALVSQSKKMVAFVGVEDLCVVDTDNVLLVAKCGLNKEIKKVVGDLKGNPQSNKDFL